MKQTLGLPPLYRKTNLKTRIYENSFLIKTIKHHSWDFVSHCVVGSPGNGQRKQGLKQWFGMVARQGKGWRSQAAVNKAWSHPGGGTGNTRYLNLQATEHQNDGKLILKY